MIWALFRKDLRLFRLPFVTGIVILVGAYLVGAVVAVGVWLDYAHDTRTLTFVQPGAPAEVTRVPIRDLIPGFIAANAVIPAALVALGLMAFLSASFGGAAFAAERRDRSADFLAMLPVTRRQVATSKLLAALFCLLVPCAVHLAVVLVGLLATGSSRTVDFATTATALRHALAMGVMMFGVAWLLSAVLDSAALAATIGIAITAATGAFVGNLATRALLATGANVYTGDPGEVVWVLINPGMYRQTVLSIYNTVHSVAVAVGVLALVAGTVIYVRRVAP
jgi:ABC-type transport system involved in multi-copper enzyme maturation permease subunit